MSTGPDVLIVYMIVWQKERDEKKKKKNYFRVRVLDQFSDTMLC